MAPRPFRWLLRLLPLEFREGYARDMEAAFEAERRDAGRRGLAATLGLWLATAADVAATAPGEHVDILRRDATVGLRALARRPLHTAAAVGALALGIGANVAMFAVADAVLLQPLPYANADALVSVSETSRGEASNVGYLSFLDLKARARGVTGLVAAAGSTATFAEGPKPAERVNAMRVSAGYFDLVGVSPALGRAFAEDEDRPTAARRVVVLSHDLWRRRFDADPAVVGRTVQISDTPFTVVGVMPAGFDDLVASRLYRGAELWYPLGYDPAAAFACRTCRHLRVLGRLAPGVSAEAAEAELATLFATLEQEHPSEYTKSGARVRTLGDVFLGPVRPALALLWIGVGLLLLVACANVASLQLLAASERSGEVAVRAALGVTRGRLARQLVTESVMLSLAGALAGLVPAWAAVRLLATQGPQELPRLQAASLDARALAVTVAIALASGLVFALVPIARLGRGRSSDDLHGAGRRTDGAAAWRARAWLVAGNVAMAALLLAGAAVITRGVSRIIAVDPGFDPRQVLTMRLWAGGARFKAPEPEGQIAAAVRYYDEVQARLRALPGVRSVSAVTTLPFGGVDGYGLHVVGRFTANPEDAPSADRFAVTPGYFETMRIPLVRGRSLDGRDTQLSEKVAWINRTAAEALFAGEDPLGHQVVLGGQQGAARTIVGIVGDVRHNSLDQPPGPQVYVPHAQWAWAETQMTLVVRTEGDLAGLAATAREAVREVDASQPVTDIRPMADVVGASTATRRFVAGGLVGFGALALALAVVGLYGAVSVSVDQRRVEIGIRLALGAGAAEIRRMILAHGMRPVAWGLAAGALAVAATARLVTAADEGLAAIEPAAVAAAFVVLCAASLAACAVPAWRAGRVDPARSLRAE